MAKATKRQMIEREEDIHTELRLGKDIKEFSEELARKHKCSPTSIERQYRSIINEMAASVKEERDSLRIKLMLRNDHLYKEALKTKSIKLALDANNLQAKIGGLYQPDKKETEEKPQAPSFSFKERGLSVVPKDDDDREAGND